VSWAVATVRFACEIAAVVAVVWWGWPVWGVVAGVCVVAVWGLWVAPKSARRLSDPARLVVELVIFALAAVGYAAVGQVALAIVFAVAAAATAGLSRRYPAP
jgi:hypothetical protein